MTTSNDPDQIRAEIERTRASLSEDVNALTDKVTPSHVARRQVDKARGAVTGVKDRVMGSASDLGSATSDKASQVSGKASDLGSAVSDAPSAVTSRAAGNPLAAGMIAAGVGWLIGSLLPASEREKQAAVHVKDQASQTVAPVVSDAVKEVADNLKQPAQEAVESVKETAADAAQTVKEEGQSSVQDVQDKAVQAKDTVQESRN